MSTKARQTLEQFLDFGGSGSWEREVRFHPTRRWRFDLCNHELKLAVEYDGIHGAAHGSINGVLRDSAKLNEAQLLGWIVIRVNAKTIESGEAFTWIEEAVRQRRERAA